MQPQTSSLKQQVSRSRGGLNALMLAFALLATVAAGTAQAQLLGGFNKNPVVSLTAGSNTVNVGGSTELVATASDPDGTISKVLFYDSGNLLSQVNSPPYQLTFSTTKLGTHYVYAVAYDNKNATATSAVLNINVTPAGNLPPTVSLAASLTSIAPGQKTTLTATAADTDGTISKVVFYNGAAVIGQDTGAPYTLDFMSTVPGTYALVAEAFDNFNVSTKSATVLITVGNPTLGGGSNAAPAVSLAASPTSLNLGASTMLTASATDSDGFIAKVELYNGANLLNTITLAPYTYSFKPGATGTYTLTAKAYDNKNAITTSAPVTVNVSSVAVTTGAPLATLTVNGGNLLVTPGATVTLASTAVATTTGATVTSVSFFMNGANVGTDTTSPYSVSVTLPAAGTYSIYAQATDSLSQVGTSLTQVATAGSAPAVVTTDPDVWRLLNQATFGASQAEAARVSALGGITGWIDDQFTKPISGYPDAKYNRIQLSTSADCTTAMPGGGNYPGASPQARCARDHLTLAMVQRDFFTNAVGASDQLRQRVAWALSQILVTSAAEQDLSYAHVMSRYQSILFEEAFGNFENMLLRITYNAAMGNYLDMVNNDRPSGTRVPNENYAREIMQLFSIGLHELNTNGTPILDASNNPVPTYGQTEIVEFSRVFTGYTYATAADPTGTATGKRNARYYGAPMVPYNGTATTGHDPNAKTLLNGTVLPAGQTGKQDIDAAVRNVFMHANTGPFISKQLIQRLVTGNPSPAYVARVAAVFNDNGVGVRGDMRAVVRALLLDSEARGGKKTASDFGQLREPVLVATSMIRALSGITDGASLEGAVGALGQRPYYAPTVFNYFMPDTTIPGTSVLGPEFMIHTTNSAIGRANLVYRLVYQGYNPDTTIVDATGTRLFIAQFESLADDPAAMVAQINRVLAGGQFPAALEPTIVTAVNAVGSGTTTPTAQQRTDRARMAVYLMASSYDYQVQR